MITLAGEVLYYRRKGQVEKEKLKLHKAGNIPATIRGKLDNHCILTQLINIENRLDETTRENWRCS